MINWKLRFQNKTTLVTMVLATIAFIYLVLDTFGIIPKFDQDTIVRLALSFIDLLAIFGIVVDPTTKGVADSERAMNYVAPSVGPASIEEAEENIEVVLGPGSDIDE